MNSEESDLADDIVGDAVPQHLTPQEGAPGTAGNRKFRAWHRVRKQFIREQQWNKIIVRSVKRYIEHDLQTEPDVWGGEESNDPETLEEAKISKPLRCLVIPGDDLLDVRAMWSALRQFRCFIKFLGFNETLASPARRAYSFIAENAVTSLDRVIKGSLVIGDPFQNIANTQSQAYHHFRENGPYHIVNLDLCDSLVPVEGDTKVHRYYSALEQLMRYQLRWQSVPWLLFVTTQIDRAAVSQEGLNKVAQPTRENCNAHAEFSAKLCQIAPEAAFTSEAHTFDAESLSGDQLVRVFGVMLGKWLLKLLSAAQPRWTVKMLPSYRYVLKPDTGVEMLSLAFLLQPIFVLPTDKTGMSTLAPSPPAPADELQEALKLISAAANVRDVDAALAGDPELWAKMREASADLLASAGYDRAAYLQWVESGEKEFVA